MRRDRSDSFSKVSHLITTFCWKWTQRGTHHHEVELAVSWADGLEHKGYPAKLAAGHPWKRGWDPVTKHKHKLAFSNTQILFVIIRTGWFLLCT